MPKPTKPRKKPAKKKRMSDANLLKLQSMQVKALGEKKAKEQIERARLKVWKNKYWRMAGRLVGSFPAECKVPAKKLLKATKVYESAFELCSFAKKAVDKKKVLTFFRVLVLYHPQWDVRCAAVRGLGRIGSSETIAVFRKAVKDPDSWVRFHTVKAMEEIGSPSFARLLTDLSKQDPTEGIKKDAKEALQKIREKSKRKRQC